jgi:hypothetical protein
VTRRERDKADAGALGNRESPEAWKSPASGSTARTLLLVEAQVSPARRRCQAKLKEKKNDESRESVRM